MDENKPLRRWLSFGVSDLLWAMVVAVGFAVESSGQDKPTPPIKASLIGVTNLTEKALEECELKEVGGDLVLGYGIVVPQVFKTRHYPIERTRPTVAGDLQITLRNAGEASRSYTLKFSEISKNCSAGEIWIVVEPTGVRASAKSGLKKK